MSDVDTLIVTFQTQLSDVMETVIKTAMYEVSRLVEDGFMEEVKRRNREVESLRMQLQWLQSKLSDRVETGKSVDCTAKDDVELSRHTMVGERPEEQDDDISGGCPVKEEVEPVESWTRSHENEVTPESTQTSDNPFSTCGPESQATVEEEYGLPVVDVKEEEEVNSGGWSGTPAAAAAAGEAGPESHNTADDTETSPKQTLENSEELLQNVTKQDPQLSAAYVFAEEQEETNMATDASFQVDNISCWAGLTVATPGSLQNHRPETENDCDPRKIMRSLAQREEEPSSTLTADVTALFAPGSDQISPSRLQNSDALGVAIKQEVPVDYEQCVESHPEEKTMTKSATPFLSCSGKRHRLSSETLKQNRVTHKATVQDFMKLHSKAGTNLRLPAAIQHLHRPIKRPPHTLSNSTSAALSVVHSQVVNLNRIPSTSKATSAPPLSVQNRTGASWVGIKTQQQQSANSHQSHTNPAPHPQTHGHSGRHLLRCGQCGKCFPHPSNLKSHLQTHTGERPFICALCGRSFTKLSNLKAHRRVHTGERPYCCSACGKRFTQKCNLKRHQRIHLDVC